MGRFTAERVASKDARSSESDYRRRLPHGTPVPGTDGSRGE